MPSRFAQKPGVANASPLHDYAFAWLVYAKPVCSKAGSGECLALARLRVRVAGGETPPLQNCSVTHLYDPRALQEFRREILQVGRGDKCLRRIDHRLRERGAARRVEFRHHIVK
jgi:hypothetical protein